MLKKYVKVKRDGYTFHSFLQSDGKAWINTNLVLNGNTDTEIKAKCNSPSGNVNLFGARTITTQNTYTLGAFQDQWRFGFYDSTQSLGKSDTDWHIFKVNKRQFFVDDVLLGKGASNNFTTPKTAALFAVNSTTATGIYYGDFSCAYCKIWKDDVLVINLIPASRDSDGVCGMYDLVTDTFLTNANTVGTFTVGEEKDFYEWKEIKEIKRLKTPRLPKEYQEVEYIESTGTQWIDTGVAAKDGITAEFDVFHLFNSDNLCGYYDIPYDFRFYFSSHYGRSIAFDKTFIYATQSASDVLKRIRIKSTNGNGYQYLRVGNKETVSYLTSTISPYIGHILPLFCIKRSNGTIANLVNARLFSASFYDKDSEILSDLVPCYRKSDGEVGMYDIVNNVFHTNQGTGTFLKGEDVKFNTIKKIVRSKPMPKPNEIWEYGRTEIRPIGKKYCNGWNCNLTVLDSYYDGEKLITKCSGNNIGENGLYRDNMGTTKWVVGSNFYMFSVQYQSGVTVYLYEGNQRPSNFYANGIIYVKDSLVESYSQKYTDVTFKPLSEYRFHNIYLNG